VLTPSHLNARGVHPQVLDSLGYQEPMEPESISAGLVVAHDSRMPWEAKALRGPVNLDQHRVDLFRRHSPFPGALRRANGAMGTASAQGAFQSARVQGNHLSL
jgi:hypothetical protein